MKYLSRTLLAGACLTVAFVIMGTTTYAAKKPVTTPAVQPAVTIAVATTTPAVAVVATTTDPTASGTVVGATDVTGQNSEGTYERAIVETVSLQNQQTGNSGQQVQVYGIRFLTGPYKDQKKEIVNEIDTNPYDLPISVGDTLVILIQTNPDGSAAFYVESFDRQSAMIWLIVLFVLTLVVLSGWQGVKVALSIAISIGLIGYILIPSFLNGINPVPVAIALAGALTLISTTLSTGWNKKSLVTVIGTMGGVLVAYLISHAFGNWAHLSGLASDEDRLFFDKNPGLNPQGLLFAGIIIAAIGVVQDVAVSIASGVSEVRRANPNMKLMDLFRSGMVVGNDHMGALANTLVFAYVGASLSSLLLYQQFGGSWLKFINFDSVIDEIVRSLSGTIGLAFTVPITAILAAWVMHRTKASSIPHDPHAHHHH